MYTGPGDDPTNDHLLSDCPRLAADILTCQSAGKTVLLALGGSTDTYQLMGKDAGIDFANFLWGAFGPKSDSWVANNMPRPFDGNASQEVVLDGFDFDIENSSTDDSDGYIAMLE